MSVGNQRFAQFLGLTPSAAGSSTLLVRCAAAVVTAGVFALVMYFLAFQRWQPSLAAGVAFGVLVPFGDALLRRGPARTRRLSLHCPPPESRTSTQTVLH